MLGTEEVALTCPWCWETITVVVDLSAPEQAYVEDCEVCCRPIEMRVQVEAGQARVDPERA